MFDSTNPLDIPTSAAVVGGYVDGIYAWSAADWARFPNSVHVAISAIGTDRGVVGDVEPGCIWPVAKAVPWVKMRRAAGVDPTIYCNEMNAWYLVRQAFKRAGVKEPHYWCANYDGVAKLKPGQVARQYANPTLTHKHYDLSVVADVWPGVDSFSPPSGIGHGADPNHLPGAQDDMTPDEHKVLYTALELIRNLYFALGLPVTNPADPTTSKSPVLGNIQQSVDNLKVAAGGGLSAADSQKLAGIAADAAAIRMRVEKDLAP